ncbi:MAG: GTP-binding protein [Candidatus Lokiarchaeota archaeon]|nr:GTP-binding protein [Candidatus Lokiarchaeota archaeon]
MNQPQQKNKKYALKFCILGDGGVGKTTLVERLATGNFNPITKMTIGIDFSLIHLDIQLNLEESISIDLTVWDLGGEDRFRFMLPAYIHGADGGILLYDVTRFTSAMNLPGWLKMWRSNTDPGTPIYLVGSKFDLVTENMYPMVEQNITSLKEELGMKIHFLISTKDGIMIEDLMQTIAKEMWIFKNRAQTTPSPYKFEYKLRV